MEEQDYIIECRYEYFSPEGRKWTKWYPYITTPMKENEAKQVIKDNKPENDAMDKKTKSKHEYRLKPYSEYEDDMKSLLNSAIKSEKKSPPKRRKK